MCVSTAACLPARRTEWRAFWRRPLRCLVDAGRRHRHAACERLGLQVLPPLPVLFSRPGETLVIYVALAVTGGTVEVVELMLGRIL